VSFETHKKFHAPADIFHRIQRESDKLCKEYGLSVIEEKSNERSKSYKEYTEHKKGTSWKSKLRESIDENIQKAQSWEDFLALMQAADYEIKHGKHIKFRPAGKERFICSKTLGISYTEESLKSRIAEKLKANVALHAFSRQTKAPRKQSTEIKLLIDIENSVKAKESAGYNHWATIQNIKMIAKTTNYITEHGLTDYSVLVAKHSEIRNRRDSSSAAIKEIESSIKQIKKQIEIIDNYRKYKPIIDKLDSVIFKEKYRREHETEFILFHAAKQNMRTYFGNNKLPKIKDLREKLSALYTEKNRHYSDYYSAKDEFNEIEIIRSNVEKILGIKSERDTPTRSKNTHELE
jgi:hypothetical protein